MSTSVRVACPCCSARLSVDPATGDVLSFDMATEKPLDFDQAVGEVRSAEQRRADAFSKAFDKTRRLEDVLDKKFQEARKKAAQDPTPPRNPFDTD